MNHQQHIDKLQMLIDARRAESQTISEMEKIKQHIRLDQMARKMGAPKPRYKVPARRKVN
jgi:hypothetical protein